MDIRGGTGGGTVGGPGITRIKKKKKKVVRKPAKKKVVKKVRCAAIAKDGKRCKRMVTPPAKFCHLHKGYKPKAKKKKR